MYQLPSLSFFFVLIDVTTLHAPCIISPDIASKLVVHPHFMHSVTHLALGLAAVTCRGYRLPAVHVWSPLVGYALSPEVYIKPPYITVP